MRFFKNPDGTLNAINIFVLVTVITFLLLLLLCKSLLFDKQVGPAGNVITTTTTTTWNLCQDCSMSLKNEQITMEANTNEKIKNILETKNINISSIKFTSSNKDIVSIRTVEGDVTLVAGNEVGKATVTASYDDKSVELVVNVKASKIAEASFANKIYYAYVDKKTVLDINTSPKKASLKLLNLKSEDDSIGYFDEDNNFIGKSVGEVKVYLEQDGETTSATVHVIKNMIQIKVKYDGVYKEISEFKYPSNIDSFVEICVKIEDNNNEGYKQDSITYNVISSGKIETTVSSEGEYTLDTNAYIFKAHVKIDQTSESTDNYSIITFSLPDGSKAQLKITKE